jgi:hypothetical protein
MLRKKARPKSVAGQPLRRTKRAPSVKNENVGLSHRLNDVIERIDIMMPEMTARIAALEHLLLEKELCTRKDLTGAREYVRTLED